MSRVGTGFSWQTASRRRPPPPHHSRQCPTRTQTATSSRFAKPASSPDPWPLHSGKVEGFTQAQIDVIVEQMAAAGLAESERLAQLAVEETGFGNVPDKIRKNNFVLEDVVAAMRGMRTVGVLREDREHKVFEIAEPVGVVAGVIPSTNPTSTALFKCLISVKARCGIVLSPHPSARECIRESAAITTLRRSKPAPRRASSAA